MKSSLEIKIKKAKLQDEEEIVYLIHEALKDNQGFFLPLSPTLENAKVFFRMEVIPCLINNDPVYLAYKKNQAIGMACCSLGVNAAYALSKAVALGVLTTTLPEFRNKGVATELRTEMLKELKEKKINTVLTDISSNNVASHESCNKIILINQLELDIISHKYECSI